MFNSDNLLDLAIEGETTYRTATELSQRIAGLRQMEQAFVCALWMENHGIATRPSVGPFGEHGIRAGSRVRIRCGSPTGGSGDTHARCSHTVTVHSIDCGYAGWDYADRPIVRQQQITWSGNQGWRHTEASNVEVMA